MITQIICNNCSQKIEFEMEEYINKTIYCPSCDTLITLPKSEETILPIIIPPQVSPPTITPIVSKYKNFKEWIINVYNVSIFLNVCITCVVLFISMLEIGIGYGIVSIISLITFWIILRFIKEMSFIIIDIANSVDIISRK